MTDREGWARERGICSGGGEGRDGGKISLRKLEQGVLGKGRWREKGEGEVPGGRSRGLWVGWLGVTAGLPGVIGWSS